MLALIFLAQSGVDETRKFFEPLIDIKIVDGELSIVPEIKYAEVSNYYDSKRDLLPSGGGSWGGNQFSHRADRCQIGFRMEDDDRLSEFSVQLKSEDGGESVWMSIEGSGLTLIARNGDRSVILFQRPGSHCTLTVDDGTKTDVFRAATFDALTMGHPIEVMEGVFGPLEKFLDRAPMTRVSPDVVALALSIRPPADAERKQLDRWFAGLDDESADEREQATRLLSEHLSANPGDLLHVYAFGEADRSPEVQTRIQAILRADARRWEAFAFVLDGHLHRDLSYLAFLLESGKDAAGRLEALTGRTFESAAAWRAWIEEGAGGLRWDAQRWMYAGD